jgi:SPP1 family phage portal protein
MTSEEFYAKELIKWLHSPERLSQVCGYKYYIGKQDILLKRRTAIGEGGKRVVIDNLPNSRIIDNQYAKLVNQKVNYMLGKPLTIRTENKTYEEQLKGIFNKGFMRLMKNTLRSSLNCGIAWLYVYYKDNELAFKLMPGHEILPFWSDCEHTQLECALRYYTVTGYEGKNTVIKEKVELYKADGVYRYELDGSKLVPDMDSEDKDNFKPYTEGAEKWGQIPLIAFKVGSDEIPLIKRVKSLQDGLNVLLSNYMDCMEENIRNTILVIKNYDGEDLGQFRRNLTTYGAVKVKTVDGSQGGVETLSVEVNAENYKAIIEIFKKSIIENGMGYDAKDDRLSGNPNQMNIQSMYSDIDLDANEIETEYQAAFEELLELVNAYLYSRGKGSYSGERVEIIFNRDMLINEGEVIDNCIKSLSILSEETVVAQHPWVDDVQKELDRRKEQNSDGYDNHFSNASDNSDKVGEDNAE